MNEQQVREIRELILVEVEQILAHHRALIMYEINCLNKRIDDQSLLIRNLMSKIKEHSEDNSDDFV